MLATAVGLAVAHSSASSSPSPDADLLSHVKVNMSAYDVVGYGKAICADLEKVSAPVSSDLAQETITVANVSHATMDDAMALANGAVTYECPKYRALHVPVGSGR